MQFVVPQFIDIESKIIGPITPKQFVIFLLVAGILFISYKLADFTLFIIEAVITILIGGSFAFLKVNGQSFDFFLLNIVGNFKNPGLRIWRKQVIKLVKEKPEKLKKKDKKPVVSRKPLTASKLSQIALMVDTGGMYIEQEDEETIL